MHISRAGADATDVVVVSLVAVVHVTVIEVHVPRVGSIRHIAPALPRPPKRTGHRSTSPPKWAGKGIPE